MRYTFNNIKLSINLLAFWKLNRLYFFYYTTILKNCISFLLQLKNEETDLILMGPLARVGINH